MSRKCSICTHEKLEEIDSLIVKGISYREIGRRFGLGKDAVSRHASRHIPETLKNAYSDSEKMRVNSLIDTILSKRSRNSRRDVYFIRAIDGGPVKIGIATNVLSRLSDLQVASHRELEVVAVIRGGGEELEKALHERFKKHRVRGEWFEWCAELRDAIIEAQFSQCSWLFATNKRARWMESVMGIRSMIDDGCASDTVLEKLESLVKEAEQNILCLE